MPTEPSFRLASEDNAGVLLEMMREYYAFDGHAFDPDRARIALLAFLREPNFGRAWLISDDATPVGYIVLTLGYSLEYLGRDAFIDEFYLRDSHRRKGWGNRRWRSSKTRRAPSKSAPSISRWSVRMPAPKRSTARAAMPTTTTI